VPWRHLDWETGAADRRYVKRRRITAKVASVNIDTNRFPRLDSASPVIGFDAADRTEINIEAGLGSVSVK
jgi:hypothetical protein